ncbi:lipid II flippase MurJ [Pendulispora albinea]|uniref:Polysaccharide biosynthesis protein C-terminal domain-containing protein n=1 Tax=Pendulispora albinea TaxID=2741071 RepID=A0ABZ2M9S5_9BACT
MSGRAIVRTTLFLLPMQIVFRGGEALLPLFVAIWFGAKQDTDVYQFTWAVFNFAGSLVFSIFQDSALVPILAEVKLTRKESIPTVLGSILAHTGVIGSALSLVVGLLAMAFFSVHYQGEAWTLSMHMVPLFCVVLVAMAIKTFFYAVLNADHHYVAQPLASSMGVIAQLTVIATLRHRFGVLTIAMGTLAGELLAIAVLLVIAFKWVRLKIHLTLERPEPALRFARLVAAEVGGSAVTRINPVVDQLMAGFVGVEGALTLLRNSGDVASLPTSLLQAALLPVLLSHLSDDFAGGTLEHLRKLRATVGRAVLIVAALLVGISILLFLVRTPLLRLVFLHGEMTAAKVDLMAHLLPYHLVGLAPFGVLLVLARAHVSMKNSGIMLGMGALNAGLNAGFNVVLMNVMGLEGIALSTSCVQLAIAIVFWFRFEAKIERAQRAVAVQALT